MKRGHAFEPTVIQIRRSGPNIRSFSRCAICQKEGEKLIRKRGDRIVTYWQHKNRPEIEPVPQEACEWQGTGRLWCCKTQGHAGGHHAHRGPRRNVHDAV